MVSMRSSSAVNKKNDSNGIPPPAPAAIAADTKKYLRKKRRKPKAKQENGRTQLICLGSLLLAVVMLLRCSRQHLDWRQQQARLQWLKRAYTLKKVREEQAEVKMEAPHPVQNLRDNAKKHGKRKKKKHAMTGSGNDPLNSALEQLDFDMLENRHGGIRWIRPHLLPGIPGKSTNAILDLKPEKHRRADGGAHRQEDRAKFKVKRRHTTFEWEKENVEEKPPKVDYTKHEYTYPELLTEPPSKGSYPPLESLGELYQRWPQDALDNPPSPIVEQLLHFDFMDPNQLESAKKFRDAELPFKLYNVPEIKNATLKWTDEYLSEQFDLSHIAQNNPVNNLLRGVFSRKDLPPPPKSSGSCQESPNNFFAFFIPQAWDVAKMGLPPTRNNDFSFQRWAKHARYADAVGLDFDQPHFYFQSGVAREERHMSKEKWTFVSRDLPSWSSPTANFIVFEPESQKGIQCRFGERGVTAATHYDAGRNMVAMVTGAKRYVLSPPKECSKLGIINTRGQPAFRHSLLNFAHLDHLTEHEQKMSKEERAWLERAKDSRAVDTVLKAGEVLYIPSHWFHYITSLQKSAQCNVRSGRDVKGTKEFGGFDDVDKCDAE